MKTKELLYLVLAVLIFAVGGTIAYSKLVKKGAKTVQVEVIDPISGTFDQTALDKLHAQQNFYSKPDLTNLGNPDPFKPIQ